MYVFVPIRPCLHTLFWRKLPLSEAWGLNTGDEQCCLSLGASPRRELNTRTSQLVTNALNTDAEGDVLHKSRFCLYILLKAFTRTVHSVVLQSKKRNFWMGDEMSYQLRLLREKEGN